MLKIMPAGLFFMWTSNGGIAHIVDNENDAWCGRHLKKGAKSIVGRQSIRLCKQCGTWTRARRCPWTEMSVWDVDQDILARCGWAGMRLLFSVARETAHTAHNLYEKEEDQAAKLREQVQTVRTDMSNACRRHQAHLRRRIKTLEAELSELKVALFDKNRTVILASLYNPYELEDELHDEPSTNPEPQPEVPEE